MIFYLDGDDPASLVVPNLGALCQCLSSIYGISFVVHVLQMEALDELPTNCSALKQAHEQSRSWPTSQKASGQHPEGPQSPTACGQGRKHRGTRVLGLWR